MDKLFKSLSIMAAITLFMTACGTAAVQAERVQAESVPTNGYQTVLGKSLNDTDVADFITSNNCTSSGPFQLCRSAGLALWSDRDQIIKTAYLYISNAKGFTDYEGELPFGLTSTDTMTDVEQKLGLPSDAQALEAGWEPGVHKGDEFQDNLHYWAFYKPLGLTIVYDTAFGKDKSAPIHAIIVTQ